MLQKKQRLTKKEFARVFHKGAPFASKDFVVKYIPNKLPFSRFGVSVGLKISKKAVTRNAIRRQLYLAIGECINELPKGDYIVLVRNFGDPKELKASFMDNARIIYERKTTPT